MKIELKTGNLPETWENAINQVAISFSWLAEKVVKVFCTSHKWNNANQSNPGVLLTHNLKIYLKKPYMCTPYENILIEDALPEKEVIVTSTFTIIEIDLTFMIRHLHNKKLPQSTTCRRTDRMDDKGYISFTIAFNIQRLINGFESQ